MHFILVLMEKITRSAMEWSIISLLIYNYAKINSMKTSIYYYIHLGNIEALCIMHSLASNWKSN